MWHKMPIFKIVRSWAKMSTTEAAHLAATTQICRSLIAYSTTPRSLAQIIPRTKRQGLAGHGERLRLKLLTSSRPYALAGELVVFSWFFLEHQGTQSSFSELGGSQSSDIRCRGFFSGPIGNSEFIFRIRRNSGFILWNVAEIPAKLRLNLANIEYEILYSKFTRVYIFKIFC